MFMTSTTVMINNYRALILEIELLKVRKHFVETQIQNLIFDNNRTQAFELNMELDAIDYTILELEKVELEFNNTLLAFSSMFNDIDSYIFVNCIIKNENIEKVAKALDISVETLMGRKNVIENELDMCLE